MSKDRLPPELVNAWQRLPEKVQSAFLVAIEAAAKDPDAPPLPSRKQILRLEPGAFIYRGTRHVLKGRCWQVLQLLSDHGYVTMSHFRRTIRHVSRPTVISYVKKVRDALREALRQAGRDATSNPVVCLDRGDELAYGLQMP